MTGGLITLRFALAIRPRPGLRLGLVAASAAVLGAVLVLLRDRLSGVVDPEVFVGLLGISAVLTGLLRILGGFAAEERVGRRWTLGGIALGTLELALGALLLVTSDVARGWVADDPDGLRRIQKDHLMIQRNDQGHRQVIRWQDEQLDKGPSRALGWTWPSH
jgi:hypothetical protein